jgi:hypothetical protein
LAQNEKTRPNKLHILIKSYKNVKRASYKYLQLQKFVNHYLDADDAEDEEDEEAEEKNVAQHGQRVEQKHHKDSHTCTKFTELSEKLIN